MSYRADAVPSLQPPPTSCRTNPSAPPPEPPPAPAFRTNDFRPRHERTRAPPAAKRTQGPVTPQNARTNSFPASSRAERRRAPIPPGNPPPLRQRPGPSPTTGPRLRHPPRPCPALLCRSRRPDPRPVPPPRACLRADPSRPNRHPCLAVRPHCARAPGSPWHLLHHPPVYPKILAAPSTPGLAPIPEAPRPRRARRDADPGRARRAAGGGAVPAARPPSPACAARPGRRSCLAVSGTARPRAGPWRPFRGRLPCGDRIDRAAIDGR